MTGLYVYALVDSSLDAKLGTGIAGERLRLLTVGSATAVAGKMAQLPSISPHCLRAHDEIIRRVALASDAILPFRFGTMLATAKDLAEALSPRLGILLAALERTRGCDQMTLRLYAPATPESTRPARPALRDGGGRGTRWLRHRSTAYSLPELAVLREALSRCVHAEALELHDTPPLVASVFHLVRRSRLADYGAEVAKLEPRLAPASVVATGPWPPYAFTELE
jgi:hypothetical protein